MYSIFATMGNSILKFFLPKDKVFFQLFENVSETVVQMAEKLNELVHENERSQHPESERQNALDFNAFAAASRAAIMQVHS